MLAERNPHIGRAVAVLKELREDERTRLLVESHQKARWDEELRIEAALAEGRIEEKLEIARSALRAGMAVADIATITKLSSKEIEALH